jgi:hypothetical protein
MEYTAFHRQKWDCRGVNRPAQRAQYHPPAYEFPRADLCRGAKAEKIHGEVQKDQNVRI